MCVCVFKETELKVKTQIKPLHVAHLKDIFCDLGLVPFTCIYLHKATQKNEWNQSIMLHVKRVEGKTSMQEFGRLSVWMEAHHIQRGMRHFPPNEAPVAQC